MGIGKQLADSVGPRLARLLVTRPATPLILTGTLAVAGLGAAALNPAHGHQIPSPSVQPAALDLSSPHTFCRPDPDGDGHTECHILATQVSTVPNLGCYADPDGDGTYICYYATDPRTFH
jgi:hypothetical protein